MVYWLTIIFDALNKYSNLLLVIITAVYAGFTYKMISVMRYQFTSDIKFGNKKLGSSLEDDWFKEMIKQHPEQLKNSAIICKLCSDVFNKKPGNGSISKPNLIIKFSDGYKIKLEPRTKEYNEEKIDENTKQYWEDDLGSSVFLRGGELLNIELEYETYQLSEDLIDHMIKSSGNAEYYIEYLDNEGKKYAVKLNGAKPLDSVGRK